MPGKRAERIGDRSVEVLGGYLRGTAIVALVDAVLIGAAVNASFDTVFPQKATTRARLELVQRLRQRMSVRETGVE